MEEDGNDIVMDDDASAEHQKRSTNGSSSSSLPETRTGSTAPSGMSSMPPPPVPSSIPHLQPNHAQIASVMDSLSVEEKTRQRREKVEKWRKERLAKEQQESGKGIFEPEPEVSVTSSSTISAVAPIHQQYQHQPDSADLESTTSKKKTWSLEDDDDEEEQEPVASSSAAVLSTKKLLAPLGILGGKEDDFPSLFDRPSSSMNGEKSDTTAGIAPKRKPLPRVTAVKSKQNPFASSFGISAKTKASVSSTFSFDGDDEAEVSGGLVPLRKKMRSFPSSTVELEEDQRQGSATTADAAAAAAGAAGSSSDSVGMDVVEDGDALESYMVNVTSAVKKLQEEDRKLAEQVRSASSAAAAAKAAANAESGGVIEAEEVVGDARARGLDGDDDDDEDIIGEAAKKLAAKRKDLASVDHSVMNYEPFRKNFYIEPPELAQLTDAEVEIRRADLGDIKIRGVNCPKPIEKWAQMGLPPGVGEVITKSLKYEKPTSIQSQAIPAVMSGRDVIGIAKTGSGKTIAFLLPMFRHIKDQRPLEIMEGPVALIMTPTRELAVQIHRECKPFMKVLNLRSVCAYGGSPIKDQIAELKRGAEIIICTPGRMIDLLCANSGRVTNLKRVTYLVLDEADRMFDMGFEPQVMKMVNNIRPSRQTILFSATFPRKMEALARKILKQPLEITVGGRSTVCPDVHQIVEVREEDTKFLRLLEILGLCMAQDPDTKVLIFVDTHEHADNLLRDLLHRQYPCQSVHGGKDQADRDSTISDFKSGIINIVIATSVAARGLDVKQLKVVINYECPNHMEDYVHRCGRTGRAGNKGTAYTFITPEQDKYAIDIVQALKMSSAEVPEALTQLAEDFIQKVKAGKANYSSSGFGGKGLDRLDKDRDMVKKIQKKSHGTGYADEEEDVYTSDDEDFKTTTVRAPKEVTVAKEKEKDEAIEAIAQAAAEQVAAVAASSGTSAGDIEALKSKIAAINSKVGKEGQKTAAELIAKFTKGGGTALKKNASDSAFAVEIEINDYPQKARWKVVNKEQITIISDMSGCAITTRGNYFPPGKIPGPGERKLYLFVEGDTQLAVDRAKKEIKRILKEATLMAMEAEASGQFGRYLVTNG